MNLKLTYEDRPFQPIVLVSIDDEERGFIRVKDEEEFKRLKSCLQKS